MCITGGSAFGFFYASGEDTSVEFDDVRFANNTLDGAAEYLLWLDPGTSTRMARTSFVNNTVGRAA